MNRIGDMGLDGYEIALTKWKEIDDCWVVRVSNDYPNYVMPESDRNWVWLTADGVPLDAVDERTAFSTIEQAEDAAALWLLKRGALT